MTRERKVSRSFRNSKRSYAVVERFHRKGRAKHSRWWPYYCTTLLDRGADPELGELIVRMRGGVDLIPVLARRPRLLAVLIAKKTGHARAAMLRRIAARPGAMVSTSWMAS